jgi:hypothetical protein
MESLWYHINEIEPLLGYSCGLTVRFSSFFYLLVFKHSPSVLMASSHYPRTRPTNFCVMPLVCPQSIYPTRHRTLEPSPHNPPCGTCVFHSSYTLNEDYPYISHLHLFLSLTLRHCRLSAPHPNLKFLGTRCAVLESWSIIHGNCSPEDELFY